MEVKRVPMAQVVLRKPACHNTARSNSPSTRITSRNWRTDSQANNPPFERGKRRAFQGIAEVLQVRAQVTAARIADAEFLDEMVMVHAALGHIRNAFGVTA